MNSKPYATGLILQNLYDHLIDYANPSQEEGFFPSFVEWTIEQWSFRFYYEARSLEVLRDNNFRPSRTQLRLMEVVPSYRDFLESSNGNFEFSCPWVKIEFWGSMERNLFEFFHEAMRKEALRFLAIKFPETPGELLWDRIFLHDLELEEQAWSETFEKEFGFFANQARSYSLRSEETPYLDWQLADFQSARETIKGKDTKPEPIDWHPKLWTSRFPRPLESLSDQ